MTIEPTRTDQGPLRTRPLIPLDAVADRIVVGERSGWLGRVDAIVNEVGRAVFEIRQVVPDDTIGPLPEARPGYYVSVPEIYLAMAENELGHILLAKGEAVGENTELLNSILNDQTSRQREPRYSEEELRGLDTQVVTTALKVTRGHGTSEEYRQTIDFFQGRSREEALKSQNADAGLKEEFIDRSALFVSAVGPLLLRLKALELSEGTRVGPIRLGWRATLVFEAFKRGMRGQITQKGLLPGRVPSPAQNRQPGATIIEGTRKPTDTQ